VPPVIIKGQSHAKLPKELWDRTKQMEERKRTMTSRSRQFNTGKQERSYLTRTKSPPSPSQVCGKGKGKECMRSPPKYLSRR